MKIVYMGTPDFAVPALEALYKAGHDIAYVVTQPDSVRDRGRKVKFSPVKEKALELGLEVFQPKKLKTDAGFIQKLKDTAPDVIAVAAYGQLLPVEVLEIPKMGCINIHGSLLPRFRGAAPIQRAIIEGDEYTGITIMYMEKGIDTGDMLAKAATTTAGKTGLQLHDELAVMGAELLVDTLSKLESIVPEKQNDEEATYAHMISKQEGHVDFSKTPEEIERLIRAFDPWPGAYAYDGDRLVKFWKAVPSDKTTGKENGTVTGVSDDSIDIASAGRILKVTEIQVPGKKRVAVREFLRGDSIEIGTVLR